jgi:hypothetical protein
MELKQMGSLFKDIPAFDSFNKILRKVEV